MSANFQSVKMALAAGLVLLLASCTATFQNHGYAPSDSDLQEIIVGVDTRDSVEQSIGHPTSTGVLKTGGWYYTQSRWRYFAYRAPKIIDRQLVAISFNQAGVVENVERFTLKDGRVVALSRRVTDSNIKGISFIGQLLGNVGNFNPADMLDN